MFLVWCLFLLLLQHDPKAHIVYMSLPGTPSSSQPSIYRHYSGLLLGRLGWHGAAGPPRSPGTNLPSPESVPPLPAHGIRPPGQLEETPSTTAELTCSNLRLLTQQAGPRPHCACPRARGMPGVGVPKSRGACWGTKSVRARKGVKLSSAHFSSRGGAIAGLKERGF